MIPKFMEISKLLMFSLALAALLIPSISTAFPTDTGTYLINAVNAGVDIDFSDPAGPANDPSHSAWASAPVTDVPLAYEIFASANAQFTIDDWTLKPLKQRLLQVQSIHDGKEILFRVRWRDRTMDLEKDDVPRFFDALALLIPYSEADFPGCVPGVTSEPMIHMGMRCDGRDEHGIPEGELGAGDVRCCPVNIMFWRPDKIEIENIITNAMGTTMETAETDDPTLFHAAQVYDRNHWTVIMARKMIGPEPPLKQVIVGAENVGGPDAFMVDLVPGVTYDTVFANWNGKKEERNGIKWIGLWGNLYIEP
jgi:hypothetical protein